jgi:bacillithiol biosynthesis cysteine-adding enzyme BshC
MTATDTYQPPIAQPLTKAYVDRSDERLAAWFGYHPGNDGDWAQRFNRLKASGASRVDAAALGDVLMSYNRRHGASEATLTAIKAIAEGAPVVVGGQQAGLWTGPLLVIHKAVSIIGAAREASRKLGATIVPVFWVAGEDHDWDEANHTFVVTQEQELRKLAISRPEGARTAVSRTKLEQEQWESVIAELEAALPHSEFKPHILEKLTGLAQGADSLSDMFSRLMLHLFSEEGLVLLDADDRGVRELEAGMFRKLLEQNDELEETYHESARYIQSLGYTLQADVHPGGANLFLFHKERGDERLLLFKKDGRFHDRKESVSWTLEELLKLADQEPWQLSNNVMTRPLMQDYLLPVLSTVLGPGEIAYWALTAGAFKAMGMEMPIITPRMSYTLVEGVIAKNMDKYELTFSDVVERFQERKDEWLKRQDNLSLESRFEAVRESFTEQYGQLLELAASIQPGLAKLGETNLAKIVEQINYMEGKTVDAHNKQFEAATRQLDRVRLSLAPNGKLQERVLTMAAYWNRYGDEWLTKLLAAPYRLTGGHEVVYL